MDPRSDPSAWETAPRGARSSCPAGRSGRPDPGSELAISRTAISSPGDRLRVLFLVARLVVRLGLHLLAVLHQLLHAVHQLLGGRLEHLDGVGRVDAQVLAVLVAHEEVIAD